MPLPFLLLAIGGAFVGIGGTVHLAEEKGWTPWDDNDWGAWTLSLPFQATDFALTNTVSLVREGYDGIANWNGTSEFDYSKTGWTYLDWSRNPLYDESLKGNTRLYEINIENMGELAKKAETAPATAEELREQIAHILDLENLKQKILEKGKVELRKPFWGLEKETDWWRGTKTKDTSTLTDTGRETLIHQIDGYLTPIQNTLVYKTYQAGKQLEAFNFDPDKPQNTLNSLEETLKAVGGITASDTAYFSYLQPKIREKISPAAWDNFKDTYVDETHKKLQDALGGIDAATSTVAIAQLRTEYEKSKSQLEQILRINEVLNKGKADTTLDQFKDTDDNKKIHEANLQKFRDAEQTLRDKFDAAIALNTIAEMNDRFSIDTGGSDLNELEKQITTLETTIKTSKLTKDLATQDPAASDELATKIAALRSDIGAEKTRRATEFFDNFDPDSDLDIDKAKTGLPYLGAELQKIKEQNAYAESYKKLEKIKEKIGALGDDVSAADKKELDAGLKKAAAGLGKSEVAMAIIAAANEKKEAQAEADRIASHKWWKDAEDTAESNLPPVISDMIFGDGSDKGIGPGLLDVGKTIVGTDSATLPAAGAWLKDVSNEKGSYGRMGQDISHVVMFMLMGALGSRMLGGSWIGTIAAWTLVPIIGLMVLAKTGIIHDFTQKGSGGLGRLFSSAAADPAKTKTASADTSVTGEKTTDLASIDEKLARGVQTGALTAQTSGESTNLPAGVRVSYQVPKTGAVRLGMEDPEGMVNLSHLDEGMPVVAAVGKGSFAHPGICETRVAVRGDGSFDVCHVPEGMGWKPAQVAASKSFYDIPGVVMDSMPMPTPT